MLLPLLAAVVLPAHAAAPDDDRVVAVGVAANASLSGGLSGTGSVRLRLGRVVALEPYAGAGATRYAWESRVGSEDVESYRYGGESLEAGARVRFRVAEGESGRAVLVLGGGVSGGRATSLSIAWGVDAEGEPESRPAEAPYVAGSRTAFARVGAGVERPLGRGLTLGAELSSAVATYTTQAETAEPGQRLGEAGWWFGIAPQATVSLHVWL